MACRLRIYKSMNKTANTETKYQVRENGTDRIMGTYSTRKRARSAIDRFDNAYGAYHYHVKEIPGTVPALEVI